jgi:hypothetical protein
MQLIDLTGDRYGRLTVLGRSGYLFADRVFWSCECDCGNIVDVRSDSLLGGNTRSCGCLREEASRRNVEKAIEAKIKYDNLAIGAAYSATRTHAERRDIEFGLTYEEYKAIIQQDCHYCSAPARLRGYVRSDGSDFRFYGNTIDRKDNDEGYYVWNCVAACPRCNQSKQDRSYEAFVARQTSNNLNTRRDYAAITAFRFSAKFNNL